jgi:23S rRNA (uracil1939-C5)-methyltransferase
MAKTFTIKMEKMVAGGDCLGRLPDGRAVFVPFVLPGETVRVNLVEEKKRYARGLPDEVIESAPERITPRCIHFTECGGCQYQHLEYAHQLALKEDLIKDQFQRIANIENPPIQTIVPSPHPWYYRNHIQFHLGQAGELGYIHADAEHLLIIEECHLPMPEINALWPQLDLGAESGVYRLGIRQDTYDHLMLVLEGDDPKAPEFSEDIPISAVYTPPDARLTILAGDDHLVYSLLGRHFHVSARSFFQVNTAMAEKMITYLLENLDFTMVKQVIELYAGVGLFSAFFAPKVGHLTAVESSGSACHDFVINLDEFDNVDLYEAEAEEVLPSLDIQADLLIMDPPRTGLAPAVHDALAKLQPAQIAYISCDPATLARDVKRIISNDYHLQSVTPFDLFPHTAHIETVVLMSREKE